MGDRLGASPGYSQCPGESLSSSGFHHKQCQAGVAPATSRAAAGLLQASLSCPELHVGLGGPAALWSRWMEKLSAKPPGRTWPQVPQEAGVPLKITRVPSHSDKLYGAAEVSLPGEWSSPPAAANAFSAALGQSLNLPGEKAELLAVSHVRRCATQHLISPV